MLTRRLKISLELCKKLCNAKGVSLACFVDNAVCEVSLSHIVNTAFVISASSEVESMGLDSMPGPAACTSAQEAREKTG